MEEEFVKDGFFAPVTPGKQKLQSSVVIDGESETKGFKLFVDLGDLSKSDTISIDIPFPAMQHDDASHQADNNTSYNTQINGDGLASSTAEANNMSYNTQINGDGLASSTPEANNMSHNYTRSNGDGLAYSTPDANNRSSNTRINGNGLASSTPEKQQESKKRHNSGTDMNAKTPQKPKRHRPKILDESVKRKTAKAQVSGFQPKTPSKRSTPKPDTKKNNVKKTISKLVDLSEDVVQGVGPTRSCKRALNSDFDKEAEAENICNLFEDGDDQFMNLNLNSKDGKRFAKQYQRRRKQRMNRTGLNMVKPAKCANAENVTPESNVTDADPQSSQETANSSQLACEMDQMCGSDINISPKIYSGMRDCATSLPSSPVVRRKKRSIGCTRRRIYASKPMKFKCSRSPLVNLLEHLTEKKHRPNARLANRKKDTKRKHRKVKSSRGNRMLKMIQDYLPQECLLALKDPNEHGLLGFITAKLESLSINQEEYGQLVVGHQSVDASIVLYEGKNNAKVQARVDLDRESERAWTMLMAKGGSTTFDEQDPDKEYWDRERQATIKRVESIVSILREFQGNRRFSKWKGSVLDSVVGAYLTQNVSDHLSSSAFMLLVAKYSGRDSEGSNRSHESDCDQSLLDLFPRENVGVERLGHRGTSQEVEHCASPSENGSPKSCVTCTTTTNNQATETEISVQSKGIRTEGQLEDKNKKAQNIDWDKLRRTYSTNRERNDENMDSMDYQSVRQAPVKDLADTIKVRGMQNVLARKIKNCLDRTVQLHGTMDLEWLRDVPPKEAKDYLLNIYGIGLKSVECIRLLTLHHVAFPVDVNVGRVAVRLGWVPLQPLPGGLQMHLLEEYPIIDKVQKYLYPRLCTLDHETLYELHYHLITFGKLFCTKTNPRCEGCPLKGQCKHYASLSASKRFTLPAPATKNDTNRNSNRRDEPVVEMPASPEHHIEEFELEDIEDLCQDHNATLPNLNDYPEFDDDILTIRLDDEAYDDQNEADNSTQVGNMSQTLAIPSIPLTTSIPNYRGRLKSVHQVYVLPDSHPILVELRVDERDPDDPSPYLFAPWTIQEEGSTTRSSFPQGSDSLEVCRDIVCCSTLSKNEEHDFGTTISGTLMIPIRSANKGRFPLNGTYFQVNEVFADVESTNVPIIVPKNWLCGLERRILYCGASVSSTFRDIPMEHMHYAFTQGYYCSRGFNRKTRYTTDLDKQFHIKTSMQGKKTKGRKMEGNER